MLPELTNVPQPFLWLMVLLAIGILWKSADWFVEGAVGTAQKLNVPPMLVGLVLVSLATTAPELVTSVLAALQGRPEVALGNAVGSITVDNSVALGLAALVATTPLAASPGLIRTSGTFLVGVILVTFIFLLDGVLARWQGGVLVMLFVGYLVFAYRTERQRSKNHEAPVTALAASMEQVDPGLAHASAVRIGGLFLAGLVGVLIGAEILLMSALGLAHGFELPPVVIGLTVVALGTSVPEIATAVTSARKGHPGVGIGNVMGADILNICWVAGLSAVANPLPVERRVLFVMYPSMVIIVLTMLFMLRQGFQLTRVNGGILLSMYGIYLIVLLYAAPPGSF